MRAVPPYLLLGNFAAHLAGSVTGSLLIQQVSLTSPGRFRTIFSALLPGAVSLATASSHLSTATTAAMSTFAGGGNQLTWLACVPFAASRRARIALVL